MNNPLSIAQISKFLVRCAEISFLKTFKKDQLKHRPGSRKIIKAITKNAFSVTNKFISKCIIAYSAKTLTFVTFATKDGNIKNMIDF